MLGAVVAMVDARLAGAVLTGAVGPVRVRSPRPRRRPGPALPRRPPTGRVGDGDRPALGPHRPSPRHPAPVPHRRAGRRPQPLLQPGGHHSSNSRRSWANAFDNCDFTVPTLMPRILGDACLGQVLVEAQGDDGQQPGEVAQPRQVVGDGRGEVVRPRHHLLAHIHIGAPNTSEGVLHYGAGVTHTHPGSLDGRAALEHRRGHRHRARLRQAPRRRRCDRHHLRPAARRVDAAVAEIGPNGRSAVCDVTDEGQVAAAVAAAAEPLGPVCTSPWSTPAAGSPPARSSPATWRVGANNSTSTSSVRSSPSSTPHPCWPAPVAGRSSPSPRSPGRTPTATSPHTR